MAKEKKAAEREAHVSKYKKKIVEGIVKLMKEYPIIGAVNMENMPAASLQSMRRQLRESVIMTMTKRRLMKYAFEEAKKDKKGIEKLVPYLKGMPALMFTKENPFKLYKIIKKNKTSAPAKPGQIAPKDISVSAGPTPFAPGPVIGELGGIGIKTEVKEGKIHIKEDAVVVKEGEEIKANVAGLLTRLGIEPMEIGLDITAIYEDGVIYDKKVLDIDEEAFLKSLSDAGRWAFNLAVEAGYYTKETVEAMLPKAFREAKAVALEGNIMADAVMEEVLAKAEAQAASLKAEAKIEAGPLKEAKPEAAEKPVEEKKEEPKVEEKPKEEEKSEPPKTEPEPEVEAPKPEPKQAEQPKEEPKPVEEAPKEEVKEEPVEEAKPEAVPAEEPSAEKIEKEEKEIKEELKHIEEEIKEEEKEPEVEKIEKIEKEVEEVEEKIEKVEEEKKEIEEEKKIIIKKQEPKAEERKISEEKKKMVEEGESLFEQLKKKGTLRDVEKKEEIKKPEEPKSPEEIIAEAHKKMGEKKEEVPSAHELLKKKLEKGKKK